MNEPFKIQVPKEHYFGKYDDLTRFISYFYQIDLVKKMNPQKVLEIGIGNKTVSNYLKQNEIKIDTCDFDKNLFPDYVADIRKLPFGDASYDVTMACEILEHIPWDDVDKALKELHRVSKRYVLISIPYASIYVDFVFKFNFPEIGRILKKTFINFFFRVPLFFRRVHFSGEHYWEIGRKNYPIKKIRAVFKRYFNIIEEVRPLLNSYHHFFVLEKR